MPVRRIGTWKDALRRRMDAVIAGALPGGAPLFSILSLVDGYLYPHEAVFLRRLARDLPLGLPIVEVGSYRGRSTLCLASGIRARDGGGIVSVDPHVYGSEAELRENLAHFGLASAVEIVAAPSVGTAKGWTRPVAAVFLDGDHSQEAVEADVAAWLPHLVPGGFLLLHDAAGVGAFAGPRDVAARILVDRTQFDADGRVGSLRWGRRVGGTSPWLPSVAGAGLVDAVLEKTKRPRG
jgi:predicted O-methyltransferase YrrM